jgi:hypothetical protein
MAGIGAEFPGGGGIAPVLAVLAAVVIAAGCGSDEESTSQSASATTSPTQPSGGERARPSELERSCTRSAPRDAAAALARVGFEANRGLTPHPSGTENLSRCRLSGPGAEVEITHDSAPAARNRYFIRITELSQFSATNRHLAPRPVSGVGARRLEGAGANWVPAQRRLLSIRGGTMQAVQVYARGVSNGDLRAAAITVAREFEKLP